MRRSRRQLAKFVCSVENYQLSLIESCGVSRTLGWPFPVRFIFIEFYFQSNIGEIGETWRDLERLYKTGLFGVV